MNRLSRRDFLKAAGAGSLSLAAALTLASCGGKDQAAPQDSAPAPDASKPDNAEDIRNTGTKSDDLVADESTETGIIDEVKIGMSFSFASLTPFRNTNAQHASLIKYLYDRLAYLDGDYHFNPQGMKSATVQADGVTWDIELHDGIYDSEGNHITSADVVWFIEQYMQNGLKTYFGKIDSVTATGDYSLQIVMKDDIAEIIDMVFASTFLVSQAAFEASSDGFATGVVSTSPYKVTDFIPSSSITLERRDDYWMSEEQQQDKYFQANARKITMLTITETSQMQIALVTGNVDAFPSIQSTVAGAFVDNDDYYVCYAPSNNGYVLMFSGDEHSPVANDPDLRKAIVYAIDAEGVIKGAMDGYGELMHDVVCRTSSGYVTKWDSEEYFPYDPELAAEYLAKSNYSGQELTYIITSTMQRMGQILQAYWQAVGITVKLDVRDLATFGAAGPQEYDLYTTATGNGVANVWTQFYDGHAYPQGDKHGRCDETLNEMLYFTWKTANYNDENIDKVHQYMMEQCYGYGIALPMVVNVVHNRLGVVGTTYNTQGFLDLASCQFKA